MGRITLVCTTHKEKGQCNELELIRILETICPDVIFEEMRPLDFASYYTDRSRSTLETRAISKYAKILPVRQIPVDDYEFSENFGREMLALDEFVESQSNEYSAIQDRIHWLSCEYGFKYLNGPDCTSHLKYSEKLYEKIISHHGNAHAKNLLSRWNDRKRRREESMLDNIYSFCRNNTFTEGVFLVGVGHKLSIVEGIENRGQNEINLVDWKIWNRP